MVATDPTTRPVVVAEPMMEDQWIVRGTRDPVTALGVLVGEHDTLQLHTGEGDAEMWNVWCYSMLRRALTGWWRKIPVQPYHELAIEGCTWQLRPVDGRGPGVFEGVYFDG